MATNLPNFNNSKCHLNIKISQVRHISANFYLNQFKTIIFKKKHCLQEYVMS